MYFFVYLTTNLINGKRYIGQHKTKNVDDGYLGSGFIFKKALKKYGRENFKREILEFTDSSEKLNELEIKYIELFNAANDDSFYNITKGGMGQLGHRWSEEQKQAASERVKLEFAEGKRIPHRRRGQDNPNWGKRGPLSPMYGKHLSSETKLKLSKKAKEQYSNGRIPPMKGKHWSDEVKKKLSESHKGKMIGPDNPNYGNRWDDETRKRMSNTCITTKCHAGSRNGRSKQVKCIETGIVYECATYASQEYHCDRHWIIDCCNGDRETAGGVHWKYELNANPVPISVVREGVTTIQDGVAAA